MTARNCISPAQSFTVADSVQVSGACCSSPGKGGGGGGGGGVKLAPCTGREEGLV